jgi:nucleotide-binding universal stress UspA family protein
MKILLATDGSEYSETATKFLTRLNLSANDEITILHVISDGPFEDKEEYYYSRIKKVKQLIAPKILNSAANILKSTPAKINTELMNGYPDKCIVNKAVEADADIIIMGPKRMKGIRSRIVGSVTKSVSISSPKPVLIVKPPHRKSSNKIKILFATDGSGYATKAGETVNLMPFHDNTEIVVIHVIMPALYDIPDKFKIKVDAHVMEEMKKYNSIELEESQLIIEQATGYLSKKYSNISTLTKVGDPSDEILHAANELEVDIIVLGSKGMGGFRGIVGSISRYILSAADCSVLIGKTEAISKHPKV